jgi:hypothetical protein
MDFILKEFQIPVKDRGNQDEAATCQAKAL